MHDLPYWSTICLRICAASAILLIFAHLFSRITARAHVQRAIWLMGLLALAAIGVLELTGGSAVLVGRSEVMAGAKSDAKFKITVGDSATDAGVPSGIRKAQSAAPIASEPLQPQVPWTGIVWLSGALLLVGKSVLQTSICFIIRRNSALHNDTEAATRLGFLGERIGCGSKIQLCQSRHYTTPVAFGIWSPSVGLPLSFTTEFSGAEQDAILTHELMHLKHRDPLCRLLSDCSCALLWWNPVAWFMRRRFLESCEMAADAGSASVVGSGVVLAEALLHFAQRLSGKRVGSWSAMAEPGYQSNLSRRVQRLLEYKPAAALPLSKTQQAQMIGGGIVGLLISVSLMALLSQRVTALELNPSAPSPLTLLRTLARSKPSEPQTPTPTLRTQVAPSAEVHTSSAEPAQVTLNRIEPADANTPAEPTTSDKAILPSPEPGPKVEVTEPEPAVQSRPATAHSVTNAVALPKPVPQILIEAKWIELTGLNLNAVSIDALLPESALAGPSVAAGGTHPAPLRGQALHITTALDSARSTNVVSGSSIHPFKAILSTNERVALMKSLEGIAGTDVLSAPRMSMLSGREGQISVTQSQTILTGLIGRGTAAQYRSETMEFGPTLKIVATADEQGTIHLRIHGSVTEFNGYDDPAKRRKNYVPKTGGQLKLPLPRFQLREYTAEVEISDIETIVLGGVIIPELRRMRDSVPVLGDIPLMGRLFSTQSEQTLMKHLVLMVQARVISDQGE